jgi:putative two-component system response regulator
MLGFSLGAVDYIAKPIRPAIVQARVKTHLSLVRMEELKRTRLQIIQSLGFAAEYKDNETGRHVIRMSHYAKILALSAGYSLYMADEIFQAAPMHDIGKIGIPDLILKKPGKLDSEEWVVMKTHPIIGAEIIGEHPHGLLKTARKISLSHHEKWDGSGYPFGLKEKEICPEGRIIAIADVFDALTTERPYKKAWEIEDACDFLNEQSGKHFDPKLVPLFLQELPEILKVKEKWKETDSLVK